MKFIPTSSSLTFRPSSSASSSVSAGAFLLLLSLSSIAEYQFASAFVPSASFSSFSTTTTPTARIHNDPTYANQHQHQQFKHQEQHKYYMKDDKQNEENENENENNEANNQQSSCYLPSNTPESPTRQKRLIQLQKNMQQFKHGSDLTNLRNDIVSLKENLKWALATDDIARIIDLSFAIEEAQNQDPEYVYAQRLEKIYDIEQMRSVSKKYQMLPKVTEEALSVRQFIPRLNMEGLWLGNFGSDGTGLINVTYTGDTLIATKVTKSSANNALSNQQQQDVFFRADLGPKMNKDHQSKKQKQKQLDPIALTGTAASKWGTGKLDRYAGEGQLSSDDFQDKSFVEGQLIMFDGYFSFLFVPSKQHIFFSRPSPELTLHLMRDVIRVEDDIVENMKVENMKDHLTRCYEKDMDDSFFVRSKRKASSSTSTSSSSRKEEVRRISKKNDLLAAQEEEERFQPRQDDTNNFFALHKWMRYIDSVIKPPNNKGNFL
jgi:hypothetical protein